MRKMMMMALTAALAGCAEKAEKAEDRYSLVEKYGTSRERCVAATEVRDAYLEQGDEREYRLWHIQSSLACNAALLEEL